MDDLRRQLQQLEAMRAAQVGLWGGVQGRVCMWVEGMGQGGLGLGEWGPGLGE